MAVQRVIPEKRSAIDKIMQGLQVAQAVYGVKSAYDQNKLNQLKMKEYEEEKATKERLGRNEYTEAEQTQLYKVPPSTKDSSVGWVEKIERTPEGKIMYDPDTLEPKKKREKFYFITKDQATIQAYLNKQSESAQKLDDIETLSSGGVPMSYITTGKVKNISTKPKSGFIQSWYKEPETQEKVPIWIDPMASKSMRSGGDGVIMREPPKGISPNLTSGFWAAIESGIENPTIEDMEQNSPEFIDKKMVEYKKGIEDVDIEIKDALENIDDLFGIDYAVTKDGVVSDKNQQIEGVTTTGSWLPTTGVAGGIGRSVIGNAGARNKAAITGLTNVLLKVRSGAAITKEEAENFKAEISSAMGANDPVALRNAVARIRNKLEAKAAKLELGFPAKLKEVIYKDPRLLTTKSKLFQKKKEMSDEDAADLFLRGNK